MADKITVTLWGNSWECLLQSLKNPDTSISALRMATIDTEINTEDERKPIHQSPNKAEEHIQVATKLLSKYKKDGSRQHIERARNELLKAIYVTQNSSYYPLGELHRVKEKTFWTIVDEIENQLKANGHRYIA